MPNCDGGHYFLTMLAPVKSDPLEGPHLGWSATHTARLAQKLSLMRLGKQTALSREDADPAPFSRNRLTHFARFTLINTPNFNGKVPTDALVASVKGINPLTPGPVDEFAFPYLLFAADFDAADGDGEAALRTWTDALWATMDDDLRQIFDHCDGFDGKTATADSFHAYVKHCQIETTMPFNDYWAHDELAKIANKGSGGGNGLMGLLPWIARGAVAVMALWALALVGYILSAIFAPTSAATSWTAGVVSHVGIWILGIALVVLIAAWIAYKVILAKAKTPFPTAPNSDLRSILKSLYVQQHFTDLMIEAQTLDDAALHARFGAFLAATKPDDLDTPTQAPGEFHAPAIGAAA